MIVNYKAQDLIDLQAAIAAGPPAGKLNAVKVKLYINNIALTPSTLLTDFTPASFPGYTAGGYAAVWGAPAVRGDGAAVVVAAAIPIAPTDGTTPQTAYGYFVVNTAGTALIYAEAFDEPFGFVDATSLLLLIPAYVMGDRQAA